MINVKVLGEWHELDTINGYYKLDDLYRGVGSPEGQSPLSYVRGNAPHAAYSIQMKKSTWANQVKTYAYAAYLDPEFARISREVLASGDVELAKTIATGVLHK